MPMIGRRNIKAERITPATAILSPRICPLLLLIETLASRPHATPAMPKIAARPPTARAPTRPIPGSDRLGMKNARSQMMPTAQIATRPQTRLAIANPLIFDCCTEIMPDGGSAASFVMAGAPRRFARHPYSLNCFISAPSRPTFSPCAFRRRVACPLTTSRTNSPTKGMSVRMPMKIPTPLP
jgi:hypothetical protein